MAVGLARRAHRVRGHVVRAFLALCAAGLSAVAVAAEAPPLRTEKQKISYFLGMRVAMSLRGTPMELDTESVLRGIRDALFERRPRMSERQVAATMRAFEQELQAAARKNAQAAEVFLAQNAKRAGVRTRSSGLQYEVLRAGEGASPTLEDSVLLHYRGTLQDGTEFDSSARQGEPVSFDMEHLIPGWQESLMLMKPGGKWRVYVPAHLAYGRTGKGPQIGPNALLIFELELVKVGPRADEKDAAKPKGKELP